MEVMAPLLPPDAFAPRAPNAPRMTVGELQQYTSYFITGKWRQHVKLIKVLGGEDACDFCYNLFEKQGIPPRAICSVWVSTFDHGDVHQARYELSQLLEKHNKRSEAKRLKLEAKSDIQSISDTSEIVSIQSTLADRPMRVQLLQSEPLFTLSYGRGLDLGLIKQAFADRRKVVVSCTGMDFARIMQLIYANKLGHGAASVDGSDHQVDSKYITVNVLAVSGPNRLLDKKDTNTNSLSEADIQLQLERETGGKHASCPAGIADIVTDKQLIEIKHWNCWKAGIGQLLSYDIYFPNHELRLHFFGPRPIDILAILSVAEKYNITVTEHSSTGAHVLLYQSKTPAKATLD